MKKSGRAIIEVQGAEVSILHTAEGDFISLTDMLKAKDGEFFISDWLRNRNTVEFLGIWESVHNPAFNSGGFATIKSQAGLNSYKLSVREWVEKTGAIGSQSERGTIRRHLCPQGHRIRIRDVDQLPPASRLTKLNSIAIRQMDSLTAKTVRLLEPRKKP